MNRQTIYLKILCFLYIHSPTCSKVDQNVDQENCVGKTVEDDAADGQIVVEKGNGDRKYDEVGHEEQQHGQVPVESDSKQR